MSCPHTRSRQNLCKKTNYIFELVHKLWGMRVTSSKIYAKVKHYLGVRVSPRAPLLHRLELKGHRARGANQRGLVQDASVFWWTNLAICEL